MRKIFLIVLLAICAAFAKNDFYPSKTVLDLSKYDFIDTSLNIIQFPKGNQSFQPFFKKLDTLVFENRGKVRILHIGGSHLQADVMSGRVREHLIKEYPGANAGRGFIFPYSAARTNTPSSYASYYKGIWDASKNVLKEVKKPLGLLGIAVSTSDPRAEINLLLDKYNNEPIWGETRFRLFGYSDSGNVEPVLRVDSADVRGVYDSLSRSYLFTSPRPIDSIQIVFRWTDTTMQASVAQFIVDSLHQDSISRADSLRLDSLMADSTIPQAVKDSILKAIETAAAAPVDTAPALDSMFMGNCTDLLDSECLTTEAEVKDTTNIAQDTTKAASRDSTVADSTLPPPRPRFTLTGILAETDNPGISYTNVGINGARVPSYFDSICPLLEKELEFYKPDLIIFAIGINDANVEHFNDKQFRDNYDTLITRLKRVNPDAALLFVTNNDSYRKVRRRYVQHPNGEVARKSFFMLAEKYGAGVWDTFSIMGGLGSMSKWEKADLAKRDKVHFKSAGYHLLGDMFYKALIDAYQEHIASLPAEEPAVAPADTTAADTTAPADTTAAPADTAATKESAK